MTPGSSSSRGPGISWDRHGHAPPRSCKPDPIHPTGAFRVGGPCTATGLLDGHLTSSGLRGQEGTGSVDVECFAPDVVGHLDSVEAAYNTCKAKEMIQAAHCLDSCVYTFPHAFCIRYVDGYAEDSRIGKVFCQLEKLTLSATQRDFEIP